MKKPARKAAKSASHKPPKPHKKATPHKRPKAHKAAKSPKHTLHHLQKSAGHGKAGHGRAKAGPGVMLAEAYLPDRVDVRDHVYAAGPAAPAFVDLSPLMPPVWDQGDCSCVEVAVLAAYAFVRPSADLECHHGGTGEIREALAACAGVEYLSVPLAGLQACLSDGYPIVFGCTIFESFYADETVVELPAPGEEIAGPHCAVVVGIGYGSEWADEFPEADPATRYVKVRNAWGIDAHEAGHLLMPADYLRLHGADFWTMRG